MVQKPFLLGILYVVAISSHTQKGDCYSSTHELLKFERT